MLLYSFFFVSSSIGSLNPSVLAPLELNEGNIHEIPEFVRWKNRKKKNCQRKTITQDNIYIV